jgi:hypothetical protein
MKAIIISGADATFCVARTTTRDAKPDNAGSLAKLRWTSRAGSAKLSNIHEFVMSTLCI